MVHAGTTRLDYAAACGTQARSARLGRRCRLYTIDGEGGRLVGIDPEEGGGKSVWLVKLDAVQYE